MGELLMPKNGNTGNFPLASLALLITGFAALLACADVQRWREQYAWLSEDWPWRLVALFGGAAIFGGLVGAGFMFKSKMRWRARLLAPVAGILAGEIGALILVAPGPIWRTIFAVVVLLGTAVVFRLGAE
jgi:hypothetical protein